MTRNQKSSAVIILLALGLAGCVTMPTGPSRMALPGTGKDFDTFRADDASCREYGLQVSGAKPGDAQADSAIKSAAVGTVIGAAAGAAIGNSAQSAGAGAGVGLMVGALAGAGAGAQSGYAVQRRYDNGYTQCMYAKGHRVPVSGNMAQRYPAPPAPQAPHAQAQPPQQPLLQPQVQYYPPPPPGSAPPPPSAIVR